MKIYSFVGTSFCDYRDDSDDAPDGMTLMKADRPGVDFVSTKDGKWVSAASVFSVTRAQGKAALIRAGLWQGVIDFVNSISDPAEKAVAEVALNDTTHWQRSSPFLNSSAEALGLTDDQLDQLFIDASKIEL